MKKLLCSVLLVSTSACASAPTSTKLTCDPPRGPVAPVAPMPSGIHLGPPEGEHYWDGEACVSVGAHGRVGHGGDPMRPGPFPVVAFPDRDSCEVAHAHCS